MNFTDVIMAHIAWKQRLLKYIGSDRSENLDPATVSQDNQCVLGKWIYGEGNRYSDLPEYIQVRTSHATFHALAAQVIRLCDAGDLNAARHLLDHEYSQTSESVKRWLARLAMNMKDKT
jgi:nitric oxide synthase oxygenase domain/subunit